MLRGTSSQLRRLTIAAILVAMVALMMVRIAPAQAGIGRTVALAASPTFTPVHWSGSFTVTKVDTTGTNGWPDTRTVWSGQLNRRDPQYDTGHGDHITNGAYTAFSLDYISCPQLLASQQFTSDTVMYLTEENGHLQMGGMTGGEGTVTLQDGCGGSPRVLDTYQPWWSPSGLGCGPDLGVIKRGQDGHFHVDSEITNSCYGGEIVETYSVHLVSLEVYGCDGFMAPLGSAPLDRHYTTIDGTSFLNIAVAPDPDLGKFSMGVKWCADYAGTHLGVPSAYTELNDHWVALFALEMIGLKAFKTHPVTKLSDTGALASAKYGFRITPAELILTFLPAGKLLGKSEDALKAFRQARKHRVPFPKAYNDLKYAIHGAEMVFEDHLDAAFVGALNRVPGVSTSTAVGWGWTFSEAVHRAGKYFVKQILLNAGAVGISEALFQKAFVRVKLTMWRAKILVKSAAGGNIDIDNLSKTLIVEDEWDHNTV